MTLAERCRELGVVPGDIIEQGYRGDGLMRGIAGAIGEEPKAMYGHVLEITAIGEECVLSYTLCGSSGDEGKKAYKDIAWVRDGFKESSHRGCEIVRRVGRRTDKGFSWIEPDLVNIYTRLQEG